MVYLITFACYGCRLHGSESGSVDRNHNVPGTPTLEPDTNRIAAAQKRMDQPPYTLDEIRRDAVLEAIQDVCTYRAWTLFAAHIRTNHVHAVVNAETTADLVMGGLKAYASRRLNQMELDAPNRKRWARHGSTRWLWKPEQVSAAIQYVVVGQGESMAVFAANDI